MDSALICHEFRNQSDVLVRFQANIRLAAKGDKNPQTNCVSFLEMVRLAHLTLDLLERLVCRLE
jgi:hypothetical protein